MANTAFERIINLNLKTLPPKLAQETQVRIARHQLARVLGNGPDKPQYSLFVDGAPAVDENTVKPFGVITYIFVRFGQVGRFVLNTARDQSPVASGRYKRSWILVADRVQVEENSVPMNCEELILVNTQPYSRKIHVRGARLRGVPPGIVERVRQIALRRFRATFNIDMKYITLAGGYKLKHNYIQTRKNGKRRLHTKAGEELTYPALVITSKV